MENKRKKTGGRKASIPNKTLSDERVKQITPEIIIGTFYLISELREKAELTLEQEEKLSNLYTLMKDVLDSKSIKKVMSIRKKIQEVSNDTSTELL